MKQPSEPTETPVEETVTGPASSRKELIIGGIVIIVAMVIIGAIAIFIHNTTTKIDYQPAIACELFTLDEAKELMGANSIGSGVTEPTLSGNLSTSKCGYTDGNVDTANLVVAAIIVRSGVNDKGVTQNKEEFESGRPLDNVQLVNGVGDSAYFNEANGQLNILDGYNWVIVSYGPGSDPVANTLEDSVELAKKVIN